MMLSRIIRISYLFWGLFFGLFFLPQISQAQRLTDKIVDLEVSAGIQYLKFGEQPIKGTANLNFTLNNFYLGGGILGSSDMKLDVGYHIINSDEFVLTPGYERISFMADHAFANALFLQGQLMVSDFSFIKLRGAYIYSQNAGILASFSPQIEYGFRFDLTGNSMVRDRDNSWSSWFSDMW